MAKRLRRMPTDVNQLAKAIVDLSTGQIKPEEIRQKDPAAVALGLKGGSKGGRARAQNLSAKRRSQIARKAAKTRWRKENA